MSSIKKIDFKNFSWINISKPAKEDIEKLGVDYGFHPLDLADCIAPSYRSKIDIYKNYTFIVLLFPVYNYQTQEITATELDVFISNKYLITIHRDELKIFNDFFNLCQITPSQKQKYTDKSPERLFYEILNRLYIYLFPMVDHLVKDCDLIEKAIFSGSEQKMIYEILIIRRNITDVRKMAQVYKNILKKAITEFKDNSLYVMNKTDIYFESLIDATKEIWDMLENLKERIEALQQTNESQISFKLSNTMKILTVISVITLPITLLATIFGMSLISSMPLYTNPFGFWYVLTGMAAVLSVMLIVFRKKGWL